MRLARRPPPGDSQKITVHDPMKDCQTRRTVRRLSPAVAVSIAALLVAMTTAPAFAEDPVEDPPVDHAQKTRKALVGPCDATCKWISAALAAMSVAAIANLDKENTATIGDFTRFLPGAAGLAMTLSAKDWQGLKQWLLAGGLSLGATDALKRVTNKERPNAHNFRSFPSGHATAGFFGAGFISQRYGPRWGVPAWMIAAYTGASRVNAQRHYLDDVLSSLSLGLMSNWLVTTPISDRVAVNPMLVGDGFGLSVSFPIVPTASLGGDAGGAIRHPRFRYAWEFGPTRISENVVTEVDNPIDFRFDGLNDPLYSARFDLDWCPADPRHEIDFSLTPFEIRDFGTFDEDTEFAGVTFPAGQDLRSRHVAYDLTARYRYRLLPNGHLDLRLGGGAAVLYTLAGLAPTPRRESVGYLDFVEIKKVNILPLAHLRLGLELGRARRWEVFTEADGFALGSSRYLDATAQLRFQASPRWDFGVGYRYLERDVSSGALDNITNRRQVVANIGYRF